MPGPLHIVDDLEHAIDAAPVDTHRRADVPRELLGRPTVSGLLGHAAVDWAVLAAAWVAMWLAPWWLDLPLMVLVAGRLHAFGVILHDAAHMPLKKTAAARLLEVLCGFPIATTIEAMRYHHLRHHRDSGMPTDPYFKAGVESSSTRWLLQWLRGLLLLPFWTARAPIGVMAWFIPAWRTPYARVFLQDRSGEDLSHSEEVIACARADAGQLIFQSFLFSAVALWPSTLAWYYLLPSTLTGLLASYRVLCEHRYTPTHDRRLTTILATTRDHHLRWWERIFFAPRNIGFHVVHHIHPQVALENLPALRRWYLTRLKDRYPS